MAGFRLIGALTAFWLVLEPGWLYVISRVTAREIMTINSPERQYFFVFVTRLLLVAFVAMPAGFWLGGRVGWSLRQQRRMVWLRTTALIVGWGWFAATCAILILGLFAAGQPGLIREGEARTGRRTLQDR